MIYSDIHSASILTGYEEYHSSFNYDGHSRNTNKNKLNRYSISKQISESIRKK